MQGRISRYLGTLELLALSGLFQATLPAERINGRGDDLGLNHVVDGSDRLNVQNPNIPSGPVSGGWVSGELGHAELSTQVQDSEATKDRQVGEQEGREYRCTMDRVLEETRGGTLQT